MDTLTSLQNEIAKAETILHESRENLRQNPDSYSAKLLLISMENHLTDLLRQLDALQTR